MSFLVENNRLKGDNTMKVINIKWDTDGDKEVLKSLPTEVEIPEEMTNPID